MTGVKLETTKDRRRLHIGSYFVDLNETDYRELINIFGQQAKNNLVKPDVIKSVCPTCKNEHEITDCNGYCSAACLQEDEG